MNTGMNRAFATALEPLTFRHQRVLAMHEVERLSTQQIARVLDLTPAEARIELRHARLAMWRGLSDRARTAA
jgi:DNA-directed RNA polymerase specialized sigma24 family protein